MCSFLLYTVMFSNLTLTSTMTVAGQPDSTAPPATQPATVSAHSLTTNVQATPTAAGNSDGVSIDSLSVGVGVAGTSLVSVAAAVIIITTLVCLRKRNSKPKDTDNMPHVSSTSEADFINNGAYNTTSDHTPFPDDEIYTYISSPTSTISTSPNEAYLASDVLASTDRTATQ